RCRAQPRRPGKAPRDRSTASTTISLRAHARPRRPRGNAAEILAARPPRSTCWRETEWRGSMSFPDRWQGRKPPRVFPKNRWRSAAALYPSAADGLRQQFFRTRKGQVLQPPLARCDRIDQQHRNGHRPDAAGYRCDIGGLWRDPGEIDVADQLAVRKPVD